MSVHEFVYVSVCVCYEIYHINLYVILETTTINFTDNQYSYGDHMHPSLSHLTASGPHNSQNLITSYTLY